MTLPILIAGLILRLTSGWFNGQHEVGDICLWVGGIGLAIQLVIGLLVGSIFASQARWYRGGGRRW